MGMYKLVVEPIEGTQSSTGENTSNEVARSPRSLQAVECSVTYKDIFHISNDADIEVMGDARTP